MVEPVDTSNEPQKTQTAGVLPDPTVAGVTTEMTQKVIAEALCAAASNGNSWSWPCIKDELKKDFLKILTLCLLTAISVLNAFVKTQVA